MESLDLRVLANTLAWPADLGGPGICAAERDRIHRLHDLRIGAAVAVADVAAHQFANVSCGLAWPSLINPTAEHSWPDVQQPH